MKYEVFLRAEAELDIQDAVNWYEEHLKGIGSNFLVSIDAVINSISRNPEAYPQVYKNVRRALIRKFPFAVYFLIKKDHIVVLAVFHFSRNPKNWKSRK